MRLKEIEKRLKEIEAELRTDDADISALEKEVEELVAERKSILEDAEKREKMLKEIANQDFDVVVRSFHGAEPKEPKGYDSAEYRSAYFKNMLGIEMTNEEREAFTHTTANTAAVVPKETVDMIFSNMEEQHPIIADVNPLRTGTVINITKHTAIAAGDAKVVAEGVANNDEQNTFVSVTLSGKDIAKSIEYSYRLQAMAIAAFESYLVKEISERISAAWAKQMVAQIKTDLAVANKIAVTKTLKMEDVLKGLAALKGATGQVVVYANSVGIYSHIATMKDADTKVNFIPDYSQAIAGTVLGKPIKQEDALADGEILILDPSQYIENVVQDVLIEQDKDIKRHVHILSGILIAEGSMTNDKGAAMLTIS